MSRFHDLEIAELVRETADAVSLRFAVPAQLADSYRYAQGQHLVVEAKIGGEAVRRTYSICAGEDERELRIAIRRIAEGRFSAFANEALKVGDKLAVMPPAGSFHAELVPDQARLHLAIAAGSGITPILGIVKTVLAREPKSRVVLIYGNRSVDTILFREALEDLKNRYMTRLALHHVLSREAQDAEILQGHIDAAKLQAMAGALFRPEEVDTAYLCGPAGMIDAAQATLVALGVPAERIHSERFHVDGTAARAATAAAGPKREGEAEITVRLDGLTRRFAMPFDGAAIVDAGNEQGLNLPFSCKGGMCSTCRAKLVEGKVDMRLNYALTPKEVAGGYVLTCQSHPVSERVVLDYDV
ncbi:1,2-phenylacetyl-CoA epoxidase subunit PaaE [Desertibaculum subflavum]|uniref:1,2-phenylacetyl-CoA epoxidase subunit PaaE n=1 Tax=Desertibaculum subflavum TaxID=2268458 RepID=UPI000E67073C